MADPMIAFIAAASSLMTALAGYVGTLNARQKKAKKDIGAAFPMIRDLRDRVAALEAARGLPPLPKCLVDCERKEA